MRHETPLFPLVVKSGSEIPDTIPDPSGPDPIPILDSRIRRIRRHVLSGSERALCSPSANTACRARLCLSALPSRLIASTPQIAETATSYQFAPLIESSKGRIGYWLPHNRRRLYCICEHITARRFRSSSHRCRVYFGHKVPNSASLCGTIEYYYYN